MQKPNVLKAVGSLILGMVLTGCTSKPFGMIEDTPNSISLAATPTAKTSIMEIGPSHIVVAIDHRSEENVALKVAVKYCRSRNFASTIWNNVEAKSQYKICHFVCE